MASKRQKLARKRFREANPDVKLEGLYQKKKKGEFKRKKSGPKSDIKDQNEIKKKGFKKHPLRVPGMRPGDSCFICKAQDHIAKLCPQKAEWDKNKICFLCRQRGHSVKHCPNTNDEIVDKKLCYNCGESGHSLSQCPEPLQDGGTKFAHCFICNERGHLSKDCPENTRGIYPKGGCCKICGGVTHLAKNCPDKGKKDSNSANKEATKPGERFTGKVTRFISGDELDDDFMTENTYAIPKEVSSDSKDELVVKDGNAKSKKKKGHKVVNFVG